MCSYYLFGWVRRMKEVIKDKTKVFSWSVGIPQIYDPVLNSDIKRNEKDLIACTGSFWEPVIQTTSNMYPHQKHWTETFRRPDGPHSHANLYNINNHGPIVSSVPLLPETRAYIGRRSTYHWAIDHLSSRAVVTVEPSVMGCTLFELFVVYEPLLLVVTDCSSSVRQEQACADRGGGVSRIPWCRLYVEPKAGTPLFACRPKLDPLFFKKILPPPLK